MTVARLFFATRPTPAVCEAVAAWAQETGVGERPVIAGDIHVTLAFVGRHPEDLRAPACAVLSALAHEMGPFELPVRAVRRLGRAGAIVFDDPGGRLAKFAGALWEGLIAAGVPDRRERRGYLPHMTFTRGIGVWRSGLGEALPIRTLVPSDAAAYLSTLHPSGARYEVLDSTPLRQE